MKISNRTIYDSIYQCMILCRDNETSSIYPTTKTRFMTVISGNYSKYKTFVDEQLIKQGLVQENSNVEYYKPVYKITNKGLEYIKTYERLLELLGR